MPQGSVTIGKIPVDHSEHQRNPETLETGEVSLDADEDFVQGNLATVIKRTCRGIISNESLSIAIPASRIRQKESMPVT